MQITEVFPTKSLDSNQLLIKSSQVWNQLCKNTVSMCTMCQVMSLQNHYLQSIVVLENSFTWQSRNNQKENNQKKKKNSHFSS